MKPATDQAKVRPFILLSKSKLRLLQQSLMQSVQQWASNWGLAAQDVALDCQPAAPALARYHWQHSYAKGEQLAWLGWQPGLLAQLHNAMFDNAGSAANVVNAGSAGSVAGEAAQAALADLAHRLVQPFGLARTGAQALTPTCLAHASGAVHVQLGLDGEPVLNALLEHASWQAWWASLNPLPAASDPARAALVARTHALGKEAVRLRVQAGQAEVSVGNLLSLAVGDVIRFNHPIDTPLQVVTEQGVRVFDGFLGLQDSAKALELLPRT